MLDFYIIQDDKPIPDFPEQADLVFAGGLDYLTFENLKKKGIIEDSYNYYSDFRWEKTIIEQKIKKINQDRLESDIDIKNLLTLLDKAHVNDSGLIAYCD